MATNPTPEQLIAEAREDMRFRRPPNLLVARLADALEAAIHERDEARRERDASGAHLRETILELRDATVRLHEERDMETTKRSPDYDFPAQRRELRIRLAVGALALGGKYFSDHGASSPANVGRVALEIADAMIAVLDLEPEP